MELKLENLKITLDENVKQLRKLSDMQEFYVDQEAVDKILETRDPVIYKVYANEAEERGGLSYAVTVINAGDVGGEFYMTKGHFHKKPIAEVYMGLEGKGVLLLQDRKGKITKIPLKPGKFAYVPNDSAHRSINTGDLPLKFLAIYSSDAGHDYGTIEKEGFKEKVMR
jgi:glucose-6-phosphate isomerase